MSDVAITAIDDERAKELVTMLVPNSPAAQKRALSVLLRVLTDVVDEEHLI